MATRELVGRDAELASIDAFVADVGRGPCALVLAGDAGIGKTVLWRAGVEAARHRDSCVLTCRGVEAEASLSFSGLSELLAPVLDVLCSLSGPAPLMVAVDDVQWLDPASAAVLQIALRRLREQPVAY
jgi:predicted ATPase